MQRLIACSLCQCEGLSIINYNSRLQTPQVLPSYLDSTLCELISAPAPKPRNSELQKHMFKKAAVVSFLTVPLAHPWSLAEKESYFSARFDSFSSSASTNDRPSKSSSSSRSSSVLYRVSEHSSSKMESVSKNVGSKE
jgi:hypothetical protein